MKPDRIERSHVQAGDLDELAWKVQQLGYRLDRTPLSAGSGECTALVVGGGGLFCVVESTSVPFQSRFEAPDHIVTLGVGLRSAAPWRYAGASHGLKHIRVIPPGCDAEALAGGPQVMAHFGFSRTWLADYACATRSTGLEALSRAQPGLLHDPALASRLQRQIPRLFQADALALTRFVETMEMMAGWIADATNPDSNALPVRPQRHRSTYRTVQAAQRMIEDRLPEAIQLGEICSEIDVSRRTLERAFREHMGLSPWAYILTRRLLHARRILRQSRPEETTVGSAAIAAGLAHAGRFSTRYRALFGEHPSDTLRGLDTVASRG